MHPTPVPTKGHLQSITFADNGYGRSDDYERTHSSTYPNTPYVNGGGALYTSRAHPNGHRSASQNHNHVSSGSGRTHTMFVPDGAPGPRDGKRSKKLAGEDGKADGRLSSNGARHRSASTSQPYPHIADETTISRPKPDAQPHYDNPYLNGNTPIGLLALRAMAPHPSNRSKVLPGAAPEERIIPPRLPPAPKAVQDRGIREHENAEREARRRRRHRDREEEHRRRSYQGADEQAPRASSKGKQRSRSRPRGMAVASYSDGEEVRASGRGDNNVQNRLESAAAYVSGFGLGYDQGYSYTASAYSQTYMPPRADGYAARRQPEPSESEFEEAVGSLGLLGVPGDAVITGTVTEAHPDDELTTPRPTHTEEDHGRANGTSAWNSVSSLTLPPPPGSVREGSHRTLEQILSPDVPNVLPRPRDLRVVDVRQQHPDGRNSIHSLNSMASSWGTVHTSTRGSMSDLGLVNLNHVTVYGGGSVAGGTPLFGQDFDTPRLATFPPPPPPGFQVESGTPRSTRSHESNNEQHSGHMRSLSYSGVSLSSHDDSTERNRSHQQDEQTTQTPHSQRPSLTQSVSLDSGSLPPSNYSSQVTGNALDLTFDMAAAPFAVDTTGVTNEHIRAPAPRMGGPNVISLWGSED
jgi:hypothetical protein